MRVALNTSSPDQLVKATESFLESLCEGGKLKPGGASSDKFEATTLYQHYVTPFPINFTSLSIPTVSYSSPDSAPLKVLSGLLSAKYLHSEIREKGGAYGGGATAGSGIYLPQAFSLSFLDSRCFHILQLQGPQQPGHLLCFQPVH